MKICGQDFEDLIEWARTNGISVTIHYSEIEDLFEMEIHSAAPSECFYVKRVYSLKDFMDWWEQDQIEKSNLRAKV